jgi:hypothetical protein
LGCSEEEEVEFGVSDGWGVGCWLGEGEADGGGVGEAPSVGVGENDDEPFTSKFVVKVVVM